jgi:hypothetical protein
MRTEERKLPIGKLTISLTLVLCWVFTQPILSFLERTLPPGYYYQPYIQWLYKVAATCGFFLWLLPGREPDRSTVAAKGSTTGTANGSPASPKNDAPLAGFMATGTALSAGGTAQVGTADEYASEVDADVIIFGAGTAGASLAAALGRQGKRVIVVEK